MKTKMIEFLTKKFPAANELIINSFSEEIMNFLTSELPTDLEIHRESQDEEEEEPKQSFFNGAMWIKEIILPK